MTDIPLTPRPNTFRAMLVAYRVAREQQDERMKLAIYEKVANRLELVACAVPSWLDLDITHPLRYAIEHWKVEDFALLIGRAGVFPIEPGYQKLFQTPEDIWYMAQRGLGGDPEKRGRPSKLSESEQLLIYEQWSRGFHTQEELASLYNLGIATIRRIVKKWKPEHKI